MSEPGSSRRDGSDGEDVSWVRHPTLRRFLEKAQVDRAVAFVLLTRGWQILSGPVTFVAIARYFTPEVQGFYYTFGSLLALQSFVELGFYIVILNVASHEWAHLSLDREGRIAGSRRHLSRLVSLGQLIFKWYAAASALFVVLVGAIGYSFFSRAGQPEIEWRAPWALLVVLSALLLWTQPFISLLEGCGQVATVNRFRLYQAIASSVILWLTLAAGGELWSAATFAAAKLALALYLLLIRHREFFRDFVRAPAGPRMAWRTEIWPMQWRLALSGVVNYFVFSLATPVMFHYHGAVVAGQMGMTRVIIDALGAMAMAWVYTKTPRFGSLIAKRSWDELDRLWYRNSLVSLMVLALGIVLLWLAVWYLGVLEPEIAARLLPPLPTALFLAAAFLHQISVCQTAYLRAHKQEPILVMSVTSSLATGLLVWWLGGRFGPVGAGAGYLGVMVVAVIWETAIWQRCRARWH